MKWMKAQIESDNLCALKVMIATYEKISRHFFLTPLLTYITSQKKTKYHTG
jgi:hypothetical protein